MRLFEFMLLFSNLVAFISLIVPFTGSMSWMRHLAPIVLIMAFTQVLVEGSRWQMYPAYVLSALLFLIWLYKGIVSKRGIKIKRLAFGLVTGVTALGLVLSVSLPMIMPVFKFKKPSGPYGIGTLTYHWVDNKRMEVFTTDRNDHRELMVQIWYPAEKDLSSPATPYLQDSDIVAPG